MVDGSGIAAYSSLAQQAPLRLMLLLYELSGLHGATSACKSTVHEGQIWTVRYEQGEVWEGRTPVQGA